MGVSVQGGNGEEGLEQFVLSVCLSDEWQCLWEGTWVASSPFLCRKFKGRWQVLLSLLPAMPVRACGCSWWVSSWEIACMTLSCLHQFEFIHVSGSILFKVQLSLPCLGRLLKPLSIPNCVGRGFATKMLITEVGKWEKKVDYMWKKCCLLFFSGRSMLIVEVYNL